jgi:hypothetical protein
MSAIMSLLGKQALRAVLGIVGVAVLAGGFLAYKYFTGDTDLAKVGDCVVDAQNANDMKTVGCGDAKAKFKVVGRVEGSYTSSTAEGACKPYPSTTDVMWAESAGRQRGYVLCLEEVKK